MQTKLLALALLFIFQSCSKVERTGEKVKNPKDSSESISSDSEQLLGPTTSMYQQILTREAEQTRQQKFQQITSSETDFGMKIGSAATFFKFFEYQLLNEENFNDVSNREKLMADAATEFIRRVGDFYHKLNLKRMSPLKNGKRHRHEMAFYALAAAMHLNSSSQAELSVKMKVKQTSFYDILKSALLKSQQGSQLKEYEEILVSEQNREMMVDLIKARVDVMSALALKNLTDKSDMTFGQKMKSILFKITGGSLGAIELPETFQSSNEATKKYASDYLERSLKAKKFLSQIGIQKDLEKTLHSALSHLELTPEDEQTHLDDSTLQLRDKMLQQIKGLVD